MHVDARQLDDGTLIEGDVCIVGAGAAGIAIALEWLSARARVILLEAGGFELDAATQELYRGFNVGRRYYPLQSARLHFFGGTTGHWAGHCAPYDPIDFETRDWVPHSGWPIRREDLEPYYRRALPVVEIPPPWEFDAAFWEAQDRGLHRLPFDERRVWTKIWRFSPPTRFGTRYRRPLVEADSVRLYTHAKACEIQTNETAASVERIANRGACQRRKMLTVAGRARFRSRRPSSRVRGRSIAVHCNTGFSKCDYWRRRRKWSKKTVASPN